MTLRPTDDGKPLNVKLSHRERSEGNWAASSYVGLKRAFAGRLAGMGSA
jgi:hypothetical protein